ncbi:MAG: NAD-dependent malic enzyme [Chloroflexi bacterium]|nr:NAD-dependent malic enzyme [Chloroflexota bacterium]
MSDSSTRRGGRRHPRIRGGATVAVYKPSASYSVTLRLQLDKRAAALSDVTSAIARVGGEIGAIDIVRAGPTTVVRDLTVDASDEKHAAAIVEAVRAVPGVSVVNVSDRTFLLHLGGKIEVHPKVPLRNRDQLSMAYTPGVARVCRAIHAEPSKVFQLTIKSNTVAIVTDGSAVLGLGNIGPESALPVMEGKAMLFKEFAGVDSFPICLATQDAGEIVRTVRAIAPVFGGINLEDIAAPRCFEVEDRLKDELDIPVFHDDQHGTAIVVTAALLNALRIVDKSLADLKIVISGVGAAGMACTKMLLAAGARNVIGCDRQGAIYRGRPGALNAAKRWYAEHTNPENERGALAEVLPGADFFLGVSGPGLLTPDDVRKMARDPIVFALANPVPEILPEDVEGVVAVMATGRSDYPNQINNVLAFPGVFRGALDCRAREINEAMKLAAAEALRALIGEAELAPDYIIPSVFDKRVAPALASAVEEAAHRTGVARRHRRSEPTDEPVLDLETLGTR